MTARLGLILLLALVSISSTSLVIRYVATVPALVLAFWRMFIAGGMLWGFSAYRPQGKLSFKNKKRILFAGIFLGCHFACFFLGVRHTPIANATLLGCMVPIFTVLISVFLKKKIEKLTYIGLTIALLGAGIVQADGFYLDNENLFGNSISLLGALFIALTFILAGKIREDTGNIIYGRTLFFIAAATLLLIAIISGDSVFNFEMNHILWFLFLGLIPSIFGHNLLNYAVKYISPTAISSIPLGEPIIASLFALIIFGETIPHGALVGGPVILLGVSLILKNQIASTIE